jgi:hypothetical protein
VVWLDLTVAHAAAVLPAMASMKAAGATGPGGKEIELRDPWQVRLDFADMLVQPLNIERQRAALMREVVA